MVQLFHPDYGLVLELHALTVVTHSYALLFSERGCVSWFDKPFEGSERMRMLYTKV